MANPTATLSLNDNLISEADDTSLVTLIITFDQAMNMTVDPTVSSNAASTLTSPSGTWTSATTFEVAYTVADANVELASITFDVSGAENPTAETMVALDDEPTAPVSPSTPSRRPRRWRWTTTPSRKPTPAAR